MFILIGLLAGIVFGYTSHIKQPLEQRFQGIIEGVAVISAANWVFYNLNFHWWICIILATFVYALFLMAIQTLLTPSRFRRKKSNPAIQSPTSA